MEPLFWSRATHLPNILLLPWDLIYSRMVSMAAIPLEQVSNRTPSIAYLMDVIWGFLRNVLGIPQTRKCSSYQCLDQKLSVFWHKFSGPTAICFRMELVWFFELCGRQQQEEGLLLLPRLLVSFVTYSNQLLFDNKIYKKPKDKGKRVEDSWEPKNSVL